MKILIWTPTYGDGPHPDFVASIEAQEHEHEVVWVVDDKQKHPPPNHANVLASYRRGRARALKGGFDAMLTAEHDMILPDHALQTLTDTMGDVVYGVYLFRWGTYVLNTFEYINDKNMGESLSLAPRKARAALKKGIVRVSGCGWGCTLLRRSALERIEFPEYWKENPAFDVAFAQQAVRAGLRLYANFNVLCGHMKDDELLVPFENPSDFEYNGAAVMLGGQLMPMYRSKTDRTIFKVRALQTMNYLQDGESVRLKKGGEYELPYHVASELLRAGYLEVVSGVP
jgi:hypothetical protein